MLIQDINDWIVVPTLHQISDFIPYSEPAVSLALGTAAQESQFNYLDQTTSGPGPAYGIYQMECETHNDHLAWLKQKPDFYALVQKYQIAWLNNCLEMQGNLYYATIMMRIHYWRVPQTLPAANDVEALARYWKRWWNTSKGAGTEEQFIENWARYVKGVRRG